ncbi:MAG: hypothetical protein K2W97_07155 [Chthoniobacterales bacterium]|nr:hypothetical protein [Chthoniobacterales bacterium]
MSAVFYRHLVATPSVCGGKVSNVIVIFIKKNTVILANAGTQAAVNTELIIP